MAYCVLVLFGNWLQKQVFGELRVSELQHVKDKFWNFVFYKFIFIFGIINVQSMEGVILWGSWFSVIGFLHIHAQLCKDRFEYVTYTLLYLNFPSKMFYSLSLLRYDSVINDTLHSSSSTFSSTVFISFNTSIHRSLVFHLPRCRSTGWMDHFCTCGS